MHRRGIAIASVALVSLLLQACGEEAGLATQTVTPPTETVTPPTETVTPPTETVTPPTQTVTADSPSPSAESVLTRRDPPPKGVPEQFELYASGNGAGEPICSGPFEPGPQVVPEGYYETGPDTVPLGGWLEFCLPGFDASRRIRVEVVSPGGDATARWVAALEDRGDEYVPLAENQFIWEAFPTDELGRYSITATQGNVGSGTAFEVLPPDEPVIEVAEPVTRPPGSSFRIGLAGFEPSTDIALNLYWADPSDEAVWETGGYYYGPYRYLTSTVIEVDEDGRAAFELPTEPSDPPGGYCFFGSTPSKKYGWCDATFVLARAG